MGRLGYTRSFLQITSVSRNDLTLSQGEKKTDKVCFGLFGLFFAARGFSRRTLIRLLVV
jgi:hypothetical protein